MDETPEQKAAREAKEREDAEGGSGGNKGKGKNKGSEDDDGTETADLKAEIARLREGNRESKAEAKRLQEELDERNKKDLKEQGKYKDLYEKAEASKKTSDGDWRKKYVKSLTRGEAVHAGIADPDLAGLINVDDLAGTDMDEGELIEKIRAKIADHKAKKPKLYGQQAEAEEEEEEEEEEPAQTRNTGSRERPPSSTQTKKGGKDVRKMSREDYRDARQKHLKAIQKSQPRRY